MGDIANILGVGQVSSAEAQPPQLSSSSSMGPPRAMKLQGLSKEVIDLMMGPTSTTSGQQQQQQSSYDSGSVDLPPAVPASGYRSKYATKDVGAAGKPKNNATSSTTRPDDNLLVKVGNKWISSSKAARSWIWAPFASSARTDGLLLHHWVRNHVEYPDYPYARFDIHLDPVTYDNQSSSDLSNFYRLHLSDPDWTQGETDQLLQLARRFELRWPVIYDRWITLMEYDTDHSTANTTISSNQEQTIPAEDDNIHAAALQRHHYKKVEDLQHRYYTVASIVLQTRVAHEAAHEAQSLATQAGHAAAAAATSTATTATLSSNTTATAAEHLKNNSASLEESIRTTDQLLVETAAARALATAPKADQALFADLGTGTTNKVVFDLNYERERRSHLEALWKRTKQDEMEEAALREELKQVEAQLRKLKKTGIHLRGTTSTAISKPLVQATTPAPRGQAAAAPPGASPDIATASLSNYPIAVPGTPYLQSCRTLPPTLNSGMAGINKSLRTRMEEVLRELRVPEPPIATKRVCDLYDTVRKDVLSLLVVQRSVVAKEGVLARKRLILAKKGNNTRVVDEEALLGIAKAPSVVPSTAGAQSVEATRDSGKAARSSSKSDKSATIRSGKSKSTNPSKPKTSSSQMSNIDVGLPSLQAPGIVTSSVVKAPRKPSVPGVKRKKKAIDSGSSKTLATPAATTLGMTDAVNTQPTMDAGSLNTTNNVSIVPAGARITTATTTDSADGKGPNKKRPKKM